MASAVPTGLLRGVRQRCPNCGEGRLYRSYLKVDPACAACGHDNAQYPADDAPPYFTILIVGHLVIAPLLAFPFILTWPLGWVLGLTLPSLAALTLLVLPRVKGAVIGFHWATGPAGARFLAAPPGLGIAPESDTPVVPRPRARSVPAATGRSAASRHLAE